MLLDTAPLTWRQLQGWITSLPLAVDPIGMRRTFDTAALAASFPFTSPDLPSTSRRLRPGCPVWTQPRLARGRRVGPVGAGQLQRRRLARSRRGQVVPGQAGPAAQPYLGIDAFVIDPEDEYLALAEAVGGTVIRPGTPGVRINPLDLTLADGDDALFRRT